MLLPTLETLLTFWDGIDDLKYLRGLVCELSASVKRRFKSELDADFFLVAAALEARFKLLWVKESQLEDAISRVRRIITEAEERMRFKNRQSQGTACCFSCSKFI